MEAAFRINRLQLLALLTLIFVASFAMAQGIVTGSISGTVEDAQGAVVANANVVAKDVATNREVTGQTSDTGFFVLRGVPPGTYNVTLVCAISTPPRMSFRPATSWWTSYPIPTWFMAVSIKGAGAGGSGKTLRPQKYSRRDPIAPPQRRQP